MAEFTIDPTQILNAIHAIKAADPRTVIAGIRLHPYNLREMRLWRPDGTVYAVEAGKPSLYGAPLIPDGSLADCEARIEVLVEMKRIEAPRP